ncbi:hypothetical protein AUEXF2481DRAFT_433150 [Aureobasidium subglaciale EXF-2481]|uniref:Zn(2)-C6 fungal-type domain-containing protein n=1 Tax=Aureobasidium subglaciale (strain EXF-2481) TaxID=1043005 RepID=A0A074Y370_AURSE|nr:uncharacterized protein AUEXF2481DRAFT_433150 [Aureobasidium subglaciale EXF-2481]KEQ92140.1 hypothetical protein AUEXF2481DRAFT_433150 [Aureobasidium subglaciale EXF-2481]
MQGVRTTRGCVNCRQKKKGCDLKKPTCGRCLRLKIPCAFEDRKYVFVGQDAGSNLITKSLISTSDTSLARTDFSIIMDEYFWTNYLPQEDPSLDGSIGGILSAPWIPSVRELANSHTDVRNAIQACAMAGLGWMNEDRTLIMRAGWLYAQALRQTNMALQDPISACDDSVLACCRLLTLFEMFRRITSDPATKDPSRNQVADWRLHVNGTCRLVQLRGRERHLSTFGTELYDGVRLTAIIQGLARRRPNTFTQLEWRLPSLNMRDELYELINPAPQLLEELDMFRESEAVVKTDLASRQHIVLGTTLLERCLDIRNALREWETKIMVICREKQSFTGWMSRPPSSSSSTWDFTVPSYSIDLREPSAVRVDEQGLSLYDVCRLHGHGFFSTCTMYWTMCSIMYSSLRTHQQQLQAFMNIWTPGEVLPSLPEWVSPELSALSVAQVAGHFFKPGMGLWAAHAAVFPVSHALCYFAKTGRRDSPAFESMINAFANSKTGVIMRDFLDAIGIK